MKKMLLAAAGYAVIVFPLALGWHLGLFEEQYQTYGYFDGEPNVLAGLMGLFFWTSHVLALVAKQNVPNAGGFIYRRVE